MDDNGQKDRYDEELPSVRDLARLLKDRISAYKGGMEGVWKQIDSRFKQEGGKSVTGRKMPHENKITYDAFKKAYQRLGSAENSGILEKMRFQVNGNPLLLMNIFEILGISGYKDLLGLDFKKPDIADEIIYIGNYLKKIKRNLTDLNERIEAGHKSVNTYKLNADFEEITDRLYSVLTLNEDPLLKDPLYIEEKKSISEGYNSKLLSVVMSGDHAKLRKHKKEYDKKIEEAHIFNVLKLGFINSLEGEKKRVVLMAMIFYDYMGYTFNHSILKEYRRQLKNIDTMDASFEFSFTYILSPVFIIYFYLQIAIMFASRVADESFFAEEVEKENILKDIGKESIKAYLLNQLKHLSRELRTILNILITNKAEDIPQKNYLKYKKYAVQIIKILKKIFIDNKSIDQQQQSRNITKKYKNIEAQYRAIKRVYSGLYLINRNELLKLDLLLKDVLELQRATERDLND
jgi:hypothetical protein